MSYDLCIALGILASLLLFVYLDPSIRRFTMGMLFFVGYIILVVASAWAIAHSIHHFLGV